MAHLTAAAPIGFPPAAIDGWDRSPELTAAEREAFARLAPRRRAARVLSVELGRLVAPLRDVQRRMGYRDASGRLLLRGVLRDVRTRGTAYWAWSAAEWAATATRGPREGFYPVVGAAYLLGGHRELHREWPGFRRLPFARSVLGTAPVGDAIRQIIDQLNESGFRGKPASLWHAVHPLCGLLLDAGTADVRALTPEVIAAAYDHERPRDRHGVRQIVLVLCTTGILKASPLPRHGNSSRTADHMPRAAPDVPREWAAWCERWHHTSTLTPHVRDHYFGDLCMVGRWLAVHHPDVSSPTDWTSQTALEWRAAVTRMRVGDWSPRLPGANRERLGHPLGASRQAAILVTMRSFFGDCHEWEWIPARFDPKRAFALPRTVGALIGPNPRVIADDVWAKLVWAGLNLSHDDLPKIQGVSGAPYQYPLEMVRAVASVWLFAGLRRNEILRLRLGCIRWQGDDVDRAADDSRAVCLLDVPVNKTGTAFTKPVGRVVGDAVTRWEAVRAAQPPLVDQKTGELVHFLFMHKGATLGETFLNHSLIPLLCRKANVPMKDARGGLTSHRARATIATQLYNARDPMTLFELQAWLGHRSPLSTQHYAGITPNMLTKAYKDAGYFERNLRAVEVLIDRESVLSGAAARGEPWQYFDLGHGFCTYSFFDQCPHRMACARCDFYVPKGSTRAQLLEARGNLERMRAEIPLSEEELAAVDEGETAIDRLLEKLTDVPTPAGPTPRQLGFTPLPLTPA